MGTSESYYAVIFTSILSDHTEGYHEMAIRMEALAAQQKGYLGFESARQTIGISISYWDSLENIQAFRIHTEHLLAQEYGKSTWYKSYKVQICKVERAYEFNAL